MQTIKLSIGQVEVADTITWGMQEQIRSAMLGGLRVSGLAANEKQNLELDASVLASAKYKALELCIKKITLIDGTEIPYSKDWMDNLCIEDGDKLFDAVNAITNPKKK
ncbi:TPA: hypothetical protein DEB29_03500 [Candidatus Wolfebacteria bacterium]|nr:hypothetical protein [Candidatus Wolfebacteria bacterium]